MEDLITFVIWVCFGIICVVIADKKGRNRLLAFVWGLLGGLISVIVYLCLRPVKNEED